MNTSVLKTTIVTIAILFLPVLAFAKEGVLEIGDYTIEYDQAFEADTNNNGTNDRVSYYLKEQLVFTAYDENEDGKQDLWFRFTNGDAVDLELSDKNADGKPDTITEVNAQEKAEVIYDTQAGGGIMFGLVFFIGMGILALVFWQRKVFVKIIKEKMTHDKTIS